ncbi:uncharacterized protein LOC143464810 [Clavelina lepadiformis]|uniref:uncharacterized protein LOC143464810 n=1 Tax=Clavelina lepadiformis TaxID=159417 RepID=UPI0040438985
MFMEMTKKLDSAMCPCNNALREGLLKEKIFSNILGYATSTVSLTPVLKDKHTVVLTKTISLKNNNNGSIVVDKHGFAAFFGLEASLCCSDILLLCLSNGTIWYLPLNSSLGTPSFLYSLNDECIEVGTRKYDDTVTLLFCTKCGKVTSLIPKCDHFKVEVHWIKKDDDQLPNICCNRTNYFEQCRNSLIAKRNVLVLPRTNVFAVTNSTNLHRLRMDISELGKRRKTLNKFHEEAQTAIIRHKDLANLSIKSEDLFKYHFTESYLHVEVTDTNVSPLDFQVVLQSNSSSKTISSSSHTISVPFSDAVDCCQAKCFVCRNDVLIGSDSIKFNILNFMTYSSNVLWLEKRFSFKLLLCRSLTSQSIDFLKFLFQPEIVVKKQIFSLKIASDEIFVKFMLSSNEKQTAFHATSSNEYILWKFKSLMVYRLHNINKGSESAAL